MGDAAEPDTVAIDEAATAAAAAAAAAATEHSTSIFTGLIRGEVVGAGCATTIVEDGVG